MQKCMSNVYYLIKLVYNTNGIYLYRSALYLGILTTKNYIKKTKRRIIEKKTLFFAKSHTFTCKTRLTIFYIDNFIN